MMTQDTDFSIAILSGGQSRRMGQNKALMPLHGKPVLQWVVDAVQSLTDDLYLVTNSPDEYRQFGLPMVGDVFPGNAALGGIHSAIVHARHNWVFLLACDMPLVRARAILALARQRHNTVDAIVPRSQGRAEPLHALYRKTCLPAIEAKIAAKQLRILGFFSDVLVRYVAPETLGEQDFEFLTNLNTPADWEHVKKILKTQ